MTKVYTLPDIAPAPTSDLQGLVRRLIEYADWSVLPALLDEIREQRRDREIRWMQSTIARHLIAQGGAERVKYREFVVSLLSVWWFDLFDVTATATAMSKTPFRGPSIMGQPEAATVENVGALIKAMSADNLPDPNPFGDIT